MGLRRLQGDFSCNMQGPQWRQRPPPFFSAWIELVNCYHFPGTAPIFSAKSWRLPSKRDVYHTTWVWWMFFFNLHYSTVQWYQLNVLSAKTSQVRFRIRWTWDPQWLQTNVTLVKWIASCNSAHLQYLERDLLDTKKVLRPGRAHRHLSPSIAHNSLPLDSSSQRREWIVHTLNWANEGKIPGRRDRSRPTGSTCDTGAPEDLGFCLRPDVQRQSQSSSRRHCGWNWVKEINFFDMFSNTWE